MSKVTTAFTAVASGNGIKVNKGNSFKYEITGTFSATVVLEKTVNGGATWETILTKTAAASGNIYVIDESAEYRFRCTAYTSGTATTDKRS